MNKSNPPELGMTMTEELSVSTASLAIRETESIASVAVPLNVLKKLIEICKRKMTAAGAPMSAEHAEEGRLLAILLRKDEKDDNLSDDAAAWISQTIGYGDG